MKPPPKRLTIRALMIATAFFALDFAGIAWLERQHREGHRPLPGTLRQQVVEVVEAVDVVAPILLLIVLVYLYVPTMLAEPLIVMLILVALASLIVPTC